MLPVKRGIPCCAHGRSRAPILPILEAGTANTSAADTQRPRAA